jgi:hypothetical protein
MSHSKLIKSLLVSVTSVKQLKGELSLCNLRPGKHLTRLVMMAGLVGDVRVWHKTDMVRGPS